MEWLRLNNDGEVEIAEDEVRLVPELQKIHTLAYNKAKGDLDGRKRYRAKQELTFLYLVYSPKSPYKDYSEAERLVEAKLDCKLPADWKPSVELEALITKYQKGVRNKVSRSLQTVERFLEKFEDYLEKVNLNETTSTGGLKYDPGKIMSTLKQLPDYLLTIQELERQARQDLIGSPKSKGDHELGWMALPGATKPNQHEIRPSDTADLEEGA